MDEDRGTAQHEPVLAGTRRRTGETIPRAGSWEIVDHDGCAGHGLLRAMGADRSAPACPACEREVVWQLSHLAPSVAADHQGVGRLP
jgi:hypothetical protein